MALRTDPECGPIATHPAYPAGLNKISPPVDDCRLPAMHRLAAMRDVWQSVFVPLLVGNELTKAKRKTWSPLARLSMTSTTLRKACLQMARVRSWVDLDLLVPNGNLLLPQLVDLSSVTMCRGIMTKSNRQVLENIDNLSSLTVPGKRYQILHFNFSPKRSKNTKGTIPSWRDRVENLTLNENFMRYTLALRRRASLSCFPRLRRLSIGVYNSTSNEIKFLVKIIRSCPRLNQLILITRYLVAELSKQAPLLIAAVRDRWRGDGQGDEEDRCFWLSVSGGHTEHDQAYQTSWVVYPTETHKVPSTLSRMPTSI